MADKTEKPKKPTRLREVRNRYVAPDRSTLAVVAREAPARNGGGVLTYVEERLKGQAVKRGCYKLNPDWEQAQKEFERQHRLALERGWADKTKKPVPDSEFTDLPAAPGKPKKEEKEPRKPQAVARAR